MAAASVAFAGEAWDIADTLATDMPPTLADNWDDLWNTLLWPTMLTLLARAGLSRDAT